MQKVQPQIQSETKFLGKLLLNLLKTPLTLILILFKKKQFKDLFQPLQDFWQFIIEPKATLTLIILNILIFIVSIFLNNQSLTLFLNYPSDLFTPSRLYSLITAGFLHANLSHLLGNMLALFIFGRVVERKLGLLKTSFIYFGALLLSGIFTSLINGLILHDNTPGLGASGAIMGLIAAAILLDPFYLTYELIIPLPIMIIGWLTIYADISGILNPIKDGIGHFAHLGGFLSIGLLLYLLGIDERKKMRTGLIINIASFIIIAMIYFFVLAN